MLKKILRELWKLFLTGLFTILPIGLTIYLVIFLFTKIDSILDDAITMILAPLGFEYVKGMGFAVFLLAILLMGAFARSIIGKWMIKLVNLIMLKVPLISKIYKTISELSNAVFSDKKSIFEDVVLVEYPRKGLYSIAFVTKTRNDMIDNQVEGKLINVFIPTTPNPTSGYFIMVPEDQVININMSVETAFKMILSAGSFSEEKSGSFSEEKNDSFAEQDSTPSEEN